MLTRHILAIACFATASTVVHAKDTGPKDPQTGKSCVTYFSSELSPAGVMHMNFRNICDSPFQIHVMAQEQERDGKIGPGSPANPAKAYVACTPDDRCESSRWQYE